MTDILLGIIAASVLVMALIQVGAIIYGARLARRVDALVGRVERDLDPLVQRVNAMSADTARVTAMAVAQVERFDQAFAELTRRVDETLSTFQSAIMVPAREGAAVFSAIRSAILAVRSHLRRGSLEHGVDDEDPLFIG